jgi:hypothetical protein
MYKRFINYFVLCLCFFTSCTLTKPLPLKPFGSTDSIQKIEKTGLSKLNGNYAILSVDSETLCSLDETFFYLYLPYEKKLVTSNYVAIKAIDDNHISVTLFVDSKMIKTKIVKGRLVNNYFEFHTTQLKFRFIINAYSQQSSRLALWKDGSLYLDNNHGVIGFFVILPIPLSGSSIDIYHLKFARRESVP